MGEHVGGCNILGGRVHFRQLIARRWVTSLLVGNFTKLVLVVQLITHSKEWFLCQLKTLEAKKLFDNQT